MKIQNLNHGIIADSRRKPRLKESLQNNSNCGILISGLTGTQFHGKGQKLDLRG